MSNRQRPVNSPEVLVPAIQAQGRNIAHQQRLITELQRQVRELQAEVLRLRHQRRQRRQRERGAVAEAHANGKAAAIHSVTLYAAERGRLF